MINVAIVDDDKSYVDQLREYFEQYIKESGETIKITAFSVLKKTEEAVFW